MPRYQLRRPAPIKVFPRRRVRRQEPAPVVVPTPAPGGEVEEIEEIEEEEEEEDLDDLDSPESSPSVDGEESDSEDEEEEDEAPSPVESGAPAPESPVASSAPALPQPSSAAGNLAAVPQITIISSVSTNTDQLPAVTSAAQSRASLSPNQLAASNTITTSIRQPSSSPASGPGAVASAPAPVDSQFPLGPAQSETAGKEEFQKAEQEEPTMITPSAAAAAISLSILGVIAIMVAAVILFKRRKRRQSRYNQRVADDAFNPSNTGSLHAPETAYINSDLPVFAAAGGGGGSHLTRSTERSTLFGPGPYERPETVSTERNKTRFPIKYNPGDQSMPTPNPFADPPLNKAYDVLAGRPRSTTLTDRGSWVKNPFRNPESERFDPFGELQEKARAERRKHMEEARIEAERERAREYEKKEAMGLGQPDRLQQRKGSDATFEGIGVLDRGGAGKY